MGYLTMEETVMKECKETLAHILIMQLLVAAAMVEQITNSEDRE